MQAFVEYVADAPSCGARATREGKRDCGWMDIQRGHRSNQADHPHHAAVCKRRRRLGAGRLGSTTGKLREVLCKNNAELTHPRRAAPQRTKGGGAQAWYKSHSSSPCSGTLHAPSRTIGGRRTGIPSVRAPARPSGRGRLTRPSPSGCGAAAWKALVLRCLSTDTLGAVVAPTSVLPRPGHRGTGTPPPPSQPAPRRTSNRVPRAQRCGVGAGSLCVFATDNSAACPSP